MKIFADLHTHTVASGHAFSTVKEMAIAANQKGLEILGISDHAPKMEGAGNKSYFLCMSFIPDYLEGTRMLRGVEANIVDTKGSFDLPEKILGDLDYVIASMHDDVTPHLSVEENTNAYIKAMQKDYVKIIGHPENPHYPIEAEKFVQACVQYHKIIEINNASFKIRKSGIPKLREIIDLAKKYKAYVLLSSDAHIYTDVGNFGLVIELLKEHNFPENLIINADINMALFKECFRVK
jgi:putative hydrolase